MAKNSTRRAVVGHIGGLQRPEGLSNCRWVMVQRYLLAVASYYPKPYPSQARLAEDVGCDVRSIQRYQVLCQELGLLHVTADAGVKGKRNTWSKTHRYHIPVPPKLSGAIPDNLSSKDPSGHYVTLQVDASLSSSPKKRFSARRPPVGSNVIQMRRKEEPSSQVPRKAPAPRKSAASLLTPGSDRRGTKRVRPKERWQVLAEYFADGWRDLQAHRDNRDLRDVRDVESKGQCKSYINAHFADRTDDEVRSMMDEFFRLVSQRQVLIKNGQSAWLCFTGAWGRKRSMIDHAATQKALREYVPPQRRSS